jgi:branched-chain amino acid transport system ATP-binding protein
MILSVEGLAGGYGRMQVFETIDLQVDPGTCVAALGPNGAGKTTLLRTVCGLQRPWAGEVRLDDQQVGGWPAHRLARAGLALVPEGRHLFATLTVAENLRIAAEHAGTAGRTWTLEEIYELFPVLKERAAVEARRMSGGEQQMLAIGRALMLAPAVLALDEPSTGLAPRMVRLVMDVVRQLTEAGVGVLLVEQNAREVVRVADRVHILTHGRFSWSGTPSEMSDDAELRASYLGVGGA